MAECNRGTPATSLRNRMRFGYRGLVREALLRGAGLAAAVLLGLGAAIGLACPARPRPKLRRCRRRRPDPGSFDASSVIGGPSACPRPDAVWSELVTLVPPERLEARLRTVPRGKTPLVQIIDLGVPYRILAAGQVREYRDESRDCAYRARIAAVFVALAIESSSIAGSIAGDAARQRRLQSCRKRRHRAMIRCRRAPASTWERRSWAASDRRIASVSSEPSCAGRRGANGSVPRSAWRRCSPSTTRWEACGCGNGDCLLMPACARGARALVSHNTASSASRRRCSPNARSISPPRGRRRGSSSGCASPPACTRPAGVGHRSPPSPASWSPSPRRSSRCRQEPSGIRPSSGSAPRRASRWDLL